MAQPSLPHSYLTVLPEGLVSLRMRPMVSRSKVTVRFSSSVMEMISPRLLRVTVDLLPSLLMVSFRKFLRS